MSVYFQPLQRLQTLSLKLYAPPSLYDASSCVRNGEKQRQGFSGSFVPAASLNRTEGERVGTRSDRREKDPLDLEAEWVKYTI